MYLGSLGDWCPETTGREVGVSMLIGLTRQELSSESNHGLTKWPFLKTLLEMSQH